jgi:hypothetical protein
VALLLLSILLFIFPNKEIVFITAALAASVCGLYGLFLLISQPRLLKLFNVMSISLLLGYPLGSVINTLFNYYSTGSADPTINVFYLYYGKEDISLSLLLVLVASILLFELARFKAPLVSTFEARLKRNTDASGKYIVISVVIVTIAYLAGQIGYMGIQTGEFGEVGIWGALAFILVPPLLPITAGQITRAHSLRYRVSLILMFSLFLLSSILFGRRVFLYSLVTTLIGLSISGFRLPSISFKRFLTIAVGVPTFIIVIYVGFIFFFSLRLVVDSVGHEVPTIELLHKAKEVVQGDSPEVIAKLSSNIKERPFILSYLAGFIAAQKTYSPLWGQEVVYAFQTAIPSLLFPHKLHLLPKMPEEFVHPAFGISVFDGPNTIMTAGLNDFGIAGAIIYPALLVLIYGVFLKIIFCYFPSVLFQLVLFRLIFQLFYVEESLSGLLTTGLRDLLLITGLFLIIDKISHVTIGSNITKQEIRVAIKAPNG